MTRGRKPLPLPLHRARGTFRADRHNANAPQPTGEIPPAPRHLDKAAKAEYRRVAKIMVACRTITVADMAALASYSQAWSRMVEAEIKLRETGLIIKSPAGFPCISPYLSIAVRAGEQLRKWCSELGLTPSARSKVAVVSDAPVESDKARFFRPREAG